MPHVEAPFIIAVIREKEKSLLGENEITRLMHTTSADDAREVLMSTPYAMFLTENTSVREGLAHALEAEFLWLQQHLDNKEVLAFIAARYDALHVAQAIIALATKQAHAPETSPIGTLSHDTLQAMVFTETFTATPHTAFWLNVIKIQQEAIRLATWSMPFLFDSMQHALEERLKQLAFTPLMKELATHVKNRHESDVELRRNSELTDATAYELAWDAKAIALARALRFEPTGYDPIIAYWITKEMEIKTINLVFASLTGGFSKEETTSLIRPFAHV